MEPGTPSPVGGQHLHRTVVETMADGVTVQRADGTIVSVNAAAERILGITREQMLGTRAADPRWRAVREDGTPFPHDERPAAVALRTGVAQRDVVIGVHRPDGLLAWVSASAEPLREPGDATPRGVVVCFTDITRLKRGERMLARLIEMAPDATVGVAADGRVVLVNRRATELFGYGAREMDGLPAGRLFSARHHPARAWFEEPEPAEAGGEEGPEGAPRVLRALRRDGDEFPAQVSLSSIETEDGPVTIAAVRDLTEVHRERDRAAALLASIQDGVVVLDAQRRIVQVNRRMCEMTGMAHDDLTGLVSPLAHWSDEHRSRLDALIEDCRAGGGGEVDVTFRRPDGTEFPAIVAAAAVRDAEGAVLGFIETVKDVTERERVDRLKDEFLSVVGHELRTPLSAVTAAVEMLAETPREELADGGRRLLEIARRNGERLARLINDTLDLERLTSGGEGLEAHPASVSRMVAEAVDAVRPSAAEAGVRLVVGRLPTVDRIVCDAGRVVQVLTNYLGNAVKFSPPGAAVEVVGTRAAGELRLSVADRGRGIPPDQLERVFERFAQVDASDRRLVGGTGLGLAIARAIAEMHGGRVWAESAEDRGSTFHLALPVR